MALCKLMEAEKGAGERTLFQNSRELCFSKLDSTLLLASLSKVLTFIFSAEPLAFQKTRIISLGKNIEEDRNAPTPPHVQRALIYLPPSHSQPSVLLKPLHVVPQLRGICARSSRSLSPHAHPT